MGWVDSGGRSVCTRMGESVEGVTEAANVPPPPTRPPLTTPPVLLLAAALLLRLPPTGNSHTRIQEETHDWSCVCFRSDSEVKA